jgi:hypothetical protein
LPLFLLFACGEDKREANNAKHKLLGFLSVNKNIASFGKLDVKGVLEKSKLDKLPKVGVFMNAFKEIYKYTKIEDSIFFASESFEGKGMNFYYLVDISNRDSLVEFFRGMGLTFEEKEALMVYESSQFSIAIDENVCAIGQSDLGVNIGAKTRQLLMANNEKTTDYAILNKILSANADMVIGVDLKASFIAMYGSISSTSEVSNLLDNSFIQTTVNFNNGEIKLKTENYFSNNLNALSFLKSSDGVWAQEIVKSSAGLGYALNLDVGELINFAQKLDPTINEKLSFLQILGNNSLQDINEFSKIWDGRLAYLVNELPDSQNEMGDFKLFVGLGEGGQQLLEWFNLLYKEEEFKIKQVKNGVLVTSKLQDDVVDLNSAGDPRFQSFGKKGLTFFMDFTKLKTLEITEGVNLKNSDELDYAALEMDAQGANLSVFFKDKKRNVLELLGETAIESLYANDQIFI